MPFGRTKNNSGHEKSLTVTLPSNCRGTRIDSGRISLDELTVVETPALTARRMVRTETLQVHGPPKKRWHVPLSGKNVLLPVYGVPGSTGRGLVYLATSTTECYQVLWCPGSLVDKRLHGPPRGEETETWRKEATETGRKSAIKHGN